MSELEYRCPPRMLSASKRTQELGRTKKSEAVAVIKSVAAVIAFNVSGSFPSRRPNRRPTSKKGADTDSVGRRGGGGGLELEPNLPAYKSGDLIQNEPISRAEAACV